ncbi:hypothetical protein [uncultured Bacteroides sp.]|uniref:OmpP1/FadL family transporter n=1 Tax=uncultured Bacteroides sp. TaxID=162156 RepID=UPI002AAB5A54|nr:hypothetical protein [uncultured Bacteroides sp.]
MKKLSLISFLLLIVSVPTFAGGLLTNTNQNVAFLRNIARGASTEIDAVYSNPAGVAFLNDGFHLSFNGQSAFQTRTINSTFAPFEGNGGIRTSDSKSYYKVYKGEASAPFIPSFQAAYKKRNWTFSGSFAVTGGGGKATFNDGLASFESKVAMIPIVLSKVGFAGTNQYAVSSYMQGRQYIFGLQLGATYKLNDNLAVFGGGRMNYVSNSYFGYLRNISANLYGDEMVNLNDESIKNQLLTKKGQYSAAAAQYTTLAAAATAAGNTQLATQYTTAAASATTAVNAISSVVVGSTDKELDCDQSGWGITPIIGIDYKIGKLNLGAKYEFKTNLNIENKTKVNSTGVAAYDHGVNTPNDIPAMFTVGAQYSILPTVRASLGLNHYYDKDAKMANNKQQYLSGGTDEYLAGAEWDITDRILVSGGYQSTNYDLQDGYMSDMSFTTSSYSIGMGAAFKLTKSLKVNVAYFFTNYDKYTKVSKATAEDSKSTGYNGTGLAGTDVFTRTNKVFGVGVDYTF